MKEEREREKEFLGALLIGLILGALIGYFTFRIVTAVANTPTVTSELSGEKKVSDWSNHPIKSKKLYLEAIYLNSK